MSLFALGVLCCCSGCMAWMGAVAAWRAPGTFVETANACPAATGFVPALTTVGRHYLGQKVHCEPCNEWQVIDIPHDASVTGEYAPSENGGEGYLPLARTWYRKEFAAPVSYIVCRVELGGSTVQPEGEAGAG